MGKRVSYKPLQWAFAKLYGNLLPLQVGWVIRGVHIAFLSLYNGSISIIKVSYGFQFYVTV
jgi:hypothetical protein